MSNTADLSAVGIMDGAYFVSKRELLDWLRAEFRITIAKIEECGSGATYLQIVDKIFPGRVPMKKVKPKARQEWECLHNLKILQTVFQECGIKKHIDIDRLAKCTYLDNLEFLQWMKCFYDRSQNPIKDVPPPAGMKVRSTSIHRNSAALPTTTTTASSASSTTSSFNQPLPATLTVPPYSRAATAGTRQHSSSGGSGSQRPLIAPAPSGSLSGGQGVMGLTASGVDGRMFQTTGSYTRSLVSPNRSSTSVATSRENARLKEALEEKNREIQMLREELTQVESESRFYFGKLRKLEVMSTEEGRSHFTVPEVQNILFTEEDVSADLIPPIMNIMGGTGAGGETTNGGLLSKTS